MKPGEDIVASVESGHLEVHEVGDHLSVLGRGEGRGEGRGRGRGRGRGGQEGGAEVAGLAVAAEAQLGDGEHAASSLSLALTQHASVKTGHCTRKSLSTPHKDSPCHVRILVKLTETLSYEEHKM